MTLPWLSLGLGTLVNLRETVLLRDGVEEEEAGRLGFRSLTLWRGGSRGGGLLYQHVSKRAHDTRHEISLHW